MTAMTDLLMHREPFLFVDRIEKATEREIIGYKTFASGTDFFKGHFPGYPIVPGVILVETMIQCGGAGVSFVKAIPGSLFVLIKVENARFLKEVKPEEELRIVVENLSFNNLLLNQKGVIWVFNQKAAEAEWVCVKK